jgi:recombination protein RecT
MPDSLNKQITEAQGGPAAKPMSVEIARARPQIEAALPDNFPGGAERFVRIVTTATRMTPDLLKCSPISVIGAAMQAAQLGLTPGVLGECWLIPYKNRQTGGLEATFQIGWRGMVALAARSGLRVTGAVVHEKDEFDWELGLAPRLFHKPARGDRGKATEWYAIVRDVDTGQLASFAVLDRAMVEKRRRVSKSPDSPAWRDWYDEMSLGKAAREALRFAPLTVEMGSALASEEVVRTNIDQHPDEVGEWEVMDVPQAELEAEP